MELKMKKLFSFISVAMLGMSLLASCAESDNSAETEEEIKLPLESEEETFAPVDFEEEALLTEE